jgi:uncharacterized membrane protein
MRGHPANKTRHASTLEEYDRPVSKVDWLLFLHVTGAFFLVGGTVTAAVFTVLSRRCERPSEVATLLALVRYALPFIYAGVTLTLIFGLWLVHAAGQGYSYGATWVVAALVLWVLANACGGAGGARELRTRQLAERLAAEGDSSTEELRAQLREPLSLVLNLGSGLMVFAVLALMIWKPGA